MDTTKNAIEVTNLVKRYKELVALDHFSLTVKSGEIFGLLGPNGSGKTTTINCILSLLTYDKGDITVFGQKCAQTATISNAKSAWSCRMWPCTTS